MARYMRGYTSFETLYAIIWLAAIFGWFLNIMEFVGMIGDNEVTTMFIARIIGILVVPFGAVLGYF